MDKRKLTISLFAFAIIAGLMALTSCSRSSDACATQYCQNGGTCANGTCSCPGNFTGQHCDSCRGGYEGSDCNTLSRAKFIYQNYTVSESVSGSASGSRSYTASVLVSPSQYDQVYLSHLSNSFFLNSVTATCRGNNLTVPLQQPDAPTRQYISGSGSYAGGALSIQYTIVDSTNGNTYTCTGTWTR